MQWNAAQLALDRLIERSFPELRGSTIELKPIGLARLFTHFVTSPLSGNVCARRDVVETMPEAAARGILAHELSHAVHFRSLTWWQSCALMVRYVLSPRYRTHIERGADLETIRRGYGADLLLAKQFLRTRYPWRTRHHRHYLTEDEVRERL